MSGGMLAVTITIALIPVWFFIGYLIGIWVLRRRGEL